MLLPLFFLIFLSLFFMNTHGNNTFLPSTCPSHDCGNGLEIRYPFWHNDSDTPNNHYCGYPHFGLRCADNGQPIFSLPNDNFYVKNINYDDYTFTLVDIDVVDQTCPRARHNLTLGTLPLYHSDLNLNLSFYFNCSSHPSNLTPVKCLGSNDLRSYVVTEENDDGVDKSDLVISCEEKVEATVMKREINMNDLISGFGAAMNKGFVLDWRRMRECGACEASQGFCGYTNAAHEFLCFCKNGQIGEDHCLGRSSNLFLGVKLAIGFGSVGVGLLITCIIAICVKRKSPYIRTMGFLKKFTKSDVDIEAFLKNNGTLALKRYTYSDVKKMTNSFEETLGKGGYGSVYKGKLLDGHLVAVKLLNTSKGNGQEFINEVASISRTSHVHVVTLRGFCLEGNKRALIYEFMPNGSLERFIYKENANFKDHRPLTSEELYRIAIGVAQGLEYLHRGCNTRILHFDIKPHNILLDENFCPKISDFGLAKLSNRKESIVSMLEARGTIGYIAPEVFCRNVGGVSHKSDVYSYGMMILEMVGGRRNIDVKVSQTSEIYFPHWIYQHLEQGNIKPELLGLMTREETEIARKMILVGMWCIQTNPIDRPSMTKVIDMLEGSIEALRIPPKPYLSSPSRSTAVDSTSLSLP